MTDLNITTSPSVSLYHKWKKYYLKFKKIKYFCGFSNLFLSELAFSSRPKFFVTGTSAMNIKRVYFRWSCFYTSFWNK